MHNHAGGNALAVINVVANLGILAGYMIVPFTVLRKLPLSPSVRFSGAIFFITCGLTHLSMALGIIDSQLVVLNHLIQVFAVWFFVIGFARLVSAATKRTRRPADPPAVPTGETT